LLGGEEQQQAEESAEQSTWKVVRFEDTTVSARGQTFTLVRVWMNLIPGQGGKFLLPNHGEVSVEPFEPFTVNAGVTTEIVYRNDVVIDPNTEVRPLA